MGWSFGIITDSPTGCYIANEKGLVEIMPPLPFGPRSRPGLRGRGTGMGHLYQTPLIGYITPYGAIEFTHTKKPVSVILAETRLENGRPLRVATKERAIRDLKRVGRNVDLIQEEEEGFIDG